MLADVARDAYIESSPRHPSQKAVIWRVLNAHRGNWISGSFLEDVGGGRRYSARIHELRKAHGEDSIETKFVDDEWSFRVPA